MGSVVREWVGFQQFPVATQNKLVELFGRLKEEGMSTLTILVMGKGGVGKSSTVNSLIGERVVSVNSFQSEALRPVMVSRTRAGFTLNIIDTPGLVEGGYVSYQALELIKRFLLDKTIDILLYVDRLDAYRVDDLDKQIISAISDSFGKEIWRKSLLVLTHAQLCPPDDLNYDIFFERRSKAVLLTIRSGARLKKRDFEGPNVIFGRRFDENWRQNEGLQATAQVRSRSRRRRRRRRREGREPRRRLLQLFIQTVACMRLIVDKEEKLRFDVSNFCPSKNFFSLYCH